MKAQFYLETLKDDASMMDEVMAQYSVVYAHKIVEGNKEYRHCLIEDLVHISTMVSSLDALDPVVNGVWDEYGTIVLDYMFDLDLHINYTSTVSGIEAGVFYPLHAFAGWGVCEI